jgi:addiction module HigA family antidote
MVMIRFILYLPWCGLDLAKITRAKSSWSGGYPMIRARSTACQANYAISPGETLRETLQTKGMTQAELADRTGRPKKTINEIIAGKAAITAETALQFERVLGVPASFWNNLERNYRESIARLKEEERLQKQIE